MNQTEWAPEQTSPGMIKCNCNERFFGAYKDEQRRKHFLKCGLYSDWRTTLWRKEQAQKQTDELQAEADTLMFKRMCLNNAGFTDAQIDALMEIFGGQQ